MAERPFDRRDFHKLTSAAIGGLAAGAILGCNPGGGGGAAKNEPAKEKEGKETPSGGAAAGTLAAAELHLCRGLNECKGQGKDKQNSCRGQGACATAKEHSCGGQNECKGLGGCGNDVGANECKGKGGCHVPLMDDAWKKLREKKEADWKEKKVEAGAAPEAKKE
jgi:hypothetical protein